MFDFHADTIEVSDLTERFEVLRDEHADLATAVEDAQEAVNALDEDSDADDRAEAETELADAIKALTAFDANDNDKAEREMLAKIVDELNGDGGDHQFEGDWFPGTLIDSEYFTKYCRGLCEDVDSEILSDIPSYIAIDWDATAKNLEADYASIDIDGRSYMYR